MLCLKNSGLKYFKSKKMEDHTRTRTYMYKRHVQLIKNIAECDRDHHAKQVSDSVCWVDEKRTTEGHTYT